MNFQDDNEKDFLELQLIQSFQKLKIIDMPKFTPHKPQKKVEAKPTPQNITEEKSNIFDKDGNIELDFFSQGVNIRNTPKDIFNKVFRVATFPIEKKEFVDERLEDEEEDDDEYGDEKYDYPGGDTSDDDLNNNFDYDNFNDDDSNDEDNNINNDKTNSDVNEKILDDLLFDNVFVDDSSDETDQF